MAALSLCTLNGNQSKSTPIKEKLAPVPKKRFEFNQMIEDAKNGKIDLILVKSVSRFSRNTVDLL